MFSKDATGIFERERPVNFGSLAVAKMRPSRQFGLEHLFGRAMAAQTLTGKNANFKLCHIKPRSMDGREVKTDAPHDAIGLKDTKTFDDGLIGMGLEVVQD